MTSTNHKLIALAVLLGMWTASTGLLRSATAQTGVDSQRELAEARATIARLEDQLADMQARLAEQVAMAAKMQAVCEALKKESAVMRQRMQQSQAERDERLQGLVAVSDGLQQMSAEKAKLEAENKQLKAENDRLRKLAGVAAEPTEPQVPDPQPPKPPALVDGRVLEVTDSGIVTVSFGADDGLQVGHRLLIYRQVGDQGRYIGEVHVVRTAAKTSACKPFMKMGAIRKGDQVASRL